MATVPSHKPVGRPKADESMAARLFAVLNTSVDAIVTINEHGIIDSINPATEHIFGYSAAEMIGRNVSMLMPSPHDEAHDGYMARYLKEGSPRIIGIGREVEARRSDGTVFPCDLAVSEFEIDGKRMFTGIMRDVSERKNANMQSRLRLEELAHAGRLSDLGLTTSTIAHEVNQPLAAIVGFATACQRMLDSGKATPDTLREALGQIAEQGQRASDIIDRIRRLARKREPVVEPLNIRVVTEGVLKLLADELRSQRVVLSLTLDSVIPEVSGDRVHCEQVIMNLIKNAIDALGGVPEGERRLSISNTVADTSVTLTVRDTGPGLGSEREDKVFESFYTTKANGLGVGLAICRALAEAHDGRLWAESGSERGAVFHYQLARV